jgi:hypothetical protein
MKIIILVTIVLLCGCTNDMPIVSPKMLNVGEKPIPKELKILFDNGDSTQSKIFQKKDNFVTVQNSTIDANVLYQGADERGLTDTIKESFASKEINWKVVNAYRSAADAYCADKKMLTEFRQVISVNEVLFECISKDQYVKSSIAEMAKYCNTRRGANYGYAKPTTALIHPIVVAKGNQGVLENDYTRYLRSRLKIAGDDTNVAHFPCAEVMKLYIQ